MFKGLIEHHNQVYKFVQWQRVRVLCDPMVAYRTVASRIDVKCCD